MNTTPVPDTNRPSELSVISVAERLLADRRRLIGVPFLFACLLAIPPLFGPRSYTADGSFKPQSGVEAAASKLAGLAAQFGVNVPLDGAGDPPEFYADVVMSRTLMRRLLLTRFEVQGTDSALNGNLIDLLEITGPTVARQMEVGVKQLRRSVTVGTTKLTGVVNFSVTTDHPQLSKAVADTILALVNGYNVDIRQSQASMERRFVETRMQEAAAALRASEDTLQGFLSRNRDYSNSAQLQFAKERMERSVSMRQEVYSGLVQSYERARLDEVRNTPVITLIEKPVLPGRPDSRRVLLKGILGGFLGVAALVLAIVVQGLLAEATVADAAGAARIRALFAALRDDVRRLFRRG